MACIYTKIWYEPTCMHVRICLTRVRTRGYADEYCGLYDMMMPHFIITHPESRPLAAPHRLRACFSDSDSSGPGPPTLPHHACVHLFLLLPLLGLLSDVTCTSVICTRVHVYTCAPRSRPYSETPETIKPCICPTYMVPLSQYRRQCSGITIELSLAICGVI